MTKQNDNRTAAQVAIDLVAIKWQMNEIVQNTAVAHRTTLRTILDEMEGA